MKGIRVLAPGLLTTVQDLGRTGHQQVGMVVAGAMDPLSMQMANLLVSNTRNAAVLEITLLGPKLEFEIDTVIAITGADLSPRLNGEPVQGWRAITVSAGSVLEFGTVQCGCRAYLAAAGGLDLPLVMGSRSTYLRGQLGGYKGRALQTGDILPLMEVQPEVWLTSWYFARPVYAQRSQVRVVRGPQGDAFTEAGLSTFFTGEYTVTPQADRMGYRLQGPQIEHRDGSDIISDGIPFGAIQVPSEGQPIILMADRQATGGYTKIGTVISVDLPVVAQSKPGDILRFVEVRVEQAQQLYREMERMLRSLEESRTRVR